MVHTRRSIHSSQPIDASPRSKHLLVLFVLNPKDKGYSYCPNVVSIFTCRLLVHFMDPLRALIIVAPYTLHLYFFLLFFFMTYSTSHTIPKNDPCPTTLTNCKRLGIHRTSQLPIESIITPTLPTSKHDTSPPDIKVHTHACHTLSLFQKNKTQLHIILPQQ